ncbi:PGPGW domain-containing protein [Cellulomonas sp. NPDC055163]
MPDDAPGQAPGPDGAHSGGSGPEHGGALRGVPEWLARLPRPVRVPLVVVTGCTLLLAGTAMLVLPGPGLLVMFAGVAVLAAEFPWAGRLVVRIRLLARRVWGPVRRWLRRER